MLSLTDAILEQDVGSVRRFLRYHVDLNQLDEYGFTPLIEAAIVDNIEIAKLLLENGAFPNVQDVTGATALQWAAENNHIELCELLLKHRADPNAYNFAGQPVLVMPMLRQQSELRQLLIYAGADQVFAQDYINVKLLGHMYELVGPALIVDPQNKYVEVDFEGFFLEVTLGLISDALSQFQNHFAARQLRRYSGLTQLIVEVMQRAEQLIKYQQYRVDLGKVMGRVDAILRKEPLIIPVGYEGHAITFIKSADIWVKCDRREDSRLFDNVMVYRITRIENANNDLIKELIFTKQTDQFINVELDRLLGLEPITEIKVEAQISGNCSWANVEATIPALFFLVLMQLNPDTQSLSYFKTLALNFFHRCREWNKERALDYCIQSFKEGDAIRKACKAEILAAILFQHGNAEDGADRERMDNILTLLINSPYEYILKNYLRTYHYNSGTEEGKRFADLLKEYGYPK